MYFNAMTNEIQTFVRDQLTIFNFYNILFTEHTKSGRRLFSNRISPEYLGLMLRE